MTDANSVSNRSTLTHAAAPRSGNGSDRVRRIRNSRVAEEYRVEAKQFSKSAAVVVVLREIGLSPFVRETCV